MADLRETEMKTEAMRARFSIQKISKNYGGIDALKEVKFEIAPGEIHALVGENGAGKSTLVKVITGLEKPDSGRMLLDGVEAKFRDPMEARKNGVIAVYQDPKLFPNLDIAENVFMGVQPTTKRGFIDRKSMYRRTREVLGELGADLDPRLPVVSLSVGQRLFVEFARAMFDAHERLLLLDEPTASLSPEEAGQLFDIVRNLKDRGVSVLFISHRIEELFGFADRITILRDGTHVVTKDMVEMTQEEIVRHMVGRSLQDLYEQPTNLSEKTADVSRAHKKSALRVDDLTATGEFFNISFEVQAGEIVGMAGLVGSGRTEIAKAIFGAIPITSGTVWIDDRKVKVGDPSQMIDQGIVYVPEDREVEGLIAELSVVDNMMLPAVVKYARVGFANRRMERETYSRYSKRFQIKSSGPRVKVSSLSGGNRQKVVLSKWMNMNPEVIIFDEPTHGIDVGSKAQVHWFIQELAKQGLGILLISSDLSEILKLSDRVVVISDGLLVAEFSREDATQEKIMATAVSGIKDVDR